MRWLVTLLALLPLAAAAADNAVGAVSLTELAARSDLVRDLLASLEERERMEGLVESEARVDESGRSILRRRRRRLAASPRACR